MDFTLVLPYDVLCTIFSIYSFTNADWVKFIQVSKGWCDRVPTYARPLHREMILSWDSWLKTDSKMIPYLGPHVQNITLKKFIVNEADNRKEDGSAAFNILDTLVNNKCGSSLRRLAFDSCRFMLATSRFLTLLRSLSEANLSQLLLIKHFRHNIPIISFIRSCPKLTHFYYSGSSGLFSTIYEIPCTEDDCILLDNDDGDDFDGSRHQQTNNSNKDSANILFFPGMKCLAIDGVICYDEHIKCILDLCPNLRALQFNTMNMDLDDNVEDDVPATDFKTILQQCPALEYLEYNNDIYSDTTYTKIDDASWWKRFTEESKFDPYLVTMQQKQGRGKEQQPDNHSHLRQLLYYEGVNEEESYDVYELIVKNQKTLEHLEIGQTSRGSLATSALWNTLETVHAPNLHTLKLHRIICYQKSIVLFLEHCPSIETLSLKLCGEASTCKQILQAVQTNKHDNVNRVAIRNLTIDYQHVEIPMQPDNSNRSQLDQVLQPIYDYLESPGGGRHLERLCIIGPQKHGIVSDRLVRTISQLPNLRVLELRNRLLSRHQLVQYEMHRTFSPQQFLDNLLHYNEHLQELVLVRVNILDKKTIPRLSKLKHLEKLVIEGGNDRLDSLDVLSLLKKTNSLRTLLLRDVLNCNLTVWNNTQRWIKKLEPCCDKYIIKEFMPRRILIQRRNDQL
ncbi:hypothetical protein BDA99DRAFT_554824 [Phascolomyces articulosus]|uniref:F-box domain-containing protein n=1 Tax=Phascolomyces articulosus TaxID=60185 RepID=A0AAD5PJ52_9FUNG|nr:hypothetical protein BDA99DRAFT_554824 [Phascolomyces articulosus]